MAKVPALFVARPMMALFARTVRAWKLTSVVPSGMASQGNVARKPAVVGLTDVMLTAMALAVLGMPQLPTAVKVRCAMAPSAGPPKGPLALRVSSRRQGL